MVAHFTPRRTSALRWPDLSVARCGLLCAAFAGAAGPLLGRDVSPIIPVPNSTFWVSHEAITSRPRDVAVISNQPGLNDWVHAGARQSHIDRLEQRFGIRTVFSTNTSPEDPERIIPVIITQPTPDLLVKFKTGLGWMEGQPGGPFVQQTFIHVGPLEPYNADTFVAADFNNDTHIDVAVAFTDLVSPFPSTMRSYLGNGAGVFTPGPFLNLPPMGLVQSLSAGDLNGDARPDLFVAGSSGAHALVFENDTFRYLDIHTGATSPTATPPLPGANAGVITLFNQDNHADIVVSPTAGGVSVRLGAGAGVFQAPTALPGILSFNLVVNDFNADGLQDAAIAGQGPGIVTIYHGTPGGGIGAPFNMDASHSPDRLGVFYLPGDSRPDLFTVHKFSDVIQTYRNTDEGWNVADRTTFQNQDDIDLPTRDAVFMDTDGDGYVDLVAGDNFGHLSFTLNAADGTGAFLPTRSQDIASSIPHLRDVGVLAGQGDARRSVVVVRENSTTSVVARLNTAVSPPVWDLGNLVSLPIAATDVGVGDLNGDSRKDLVYLHAAGSVTHLFQSASGAFGGAQTVSIPGGAWNAISVLNIDSANGPDLVVADTAAGAIRTFLSDGAGGYTFAQSFFAAFPLSTNVAVGDINGDGKPDLIVGAGPSGGDAGSIHVYPQQANNTFGSPFITPFARRPVHVAVGDFNGDGRPDISAATKPATLGGDGAFGVVINSPTGITTNPPVYHYAAGDLAWADVADLRQPTDSPPDRSSDGQPVAPTLTAITLGASLSSPQESMTRIESLPPAPAPCSGDANGDGVVDFVDLNIVLTFFGQAGAPGSQPGDLDGDGDCDFVDLNIVLSAFGTVC